MKGHGNCMEVQLGLLGFLNVVKGFLKDHRGCLNVIKEMQMYLEGL